MSWFWIIYFIAVVIVPGVFALLRRDANSGSLITTLPEFLLGCVFIFLPVLNAICAIYITWFYIKFRQGHSITCGEQ
jgi:hypothetical protein